MIHNAEIILVAFGLALVQQLLSSRVTGSTSGSAEDASGLAESRARICLFAPPPDERYVHAAMRNSHTTFFLLLHAEHHTARRTNGVQNIRFEKFVSVCVVQFQLLWPPGAVETSCNLSGRRQYQNTVCFECLRNPRSPRFFFPLRAPK